MDKMEQHELALKLVDYASGLITKEELDEIAQRKLTVAVDSIALIIDIAKHTGMNAVIRREIELQTLNDTINEYLNKENK